MSHVLKTKLLEEHERARDSEIDHFCKVDDCLESCLPLARAILSPAPRLFANFQFRIKLSENRLFLCLLIVSTSLRLFLRLAHQRFGGQINFFSVHLSF